MIYVVSGKLGGGKSYHMTRLAVDQLLSGGVVATNIALDLDYISKTFKRRLLPWQYVRVDAAADPRKIPRGDFRGTRGARRVMVVLDEALNWFASQGGAKDDRKMTWGEWLRQSDKLGQDVYFVAQNFERAAKWIRELAQVAVQVTSVKHLTFLHIPFGRIPGLRCLYAVTKYDVSSQNVLSWNVHYFDKRFFSAYKTAELFGFESPESGYLASVPRQFRVPLFPFLVPLTFFALGLFYAARSVS